MRRVKQSLPQFLYLGPEVTNFERLCHDGMQESIYRPREQLAYVFVRAVRNSYSTVNWQKAAAHSR